MLSILTSIMIIIFVYIVLCQFVATATASNVYRTIASLILDTESTCCQSKIVLSLLKDELKICEQSPRNKQLLVKM